MSWNNKIKRKREEGREEKRRGKLPNQEGYDLEIYLPLFVLLCGIELGVDVCVYVYTDTGTGM